MSTASGGADALPDDSGASPAVQLTEDDKEDILHAQWGARALQSERWTARVSSLGDFKVCSACEKASW